MKTMEEYNEMSKEAAFLIVKAVRLFQNEPPHVRQQAETIIMQRVQRMMTGEKMILEGAGLVTAIDETGQMGPVNTP